MYIFELTTIIIKLSTGISVVVQDTKSVREALNIPLFRNHPYFRLFHSQLNPILSR